MEPEETRTGEIRRLTREDTLNDLGGIAEVAEDLGVPDSRLKRWIARRDVRTPPPVKPLRGIKLYSMSAWREWHRRWRMRQRLDEEE